MSEMLAIPYNLADVFDPCTATYYPKWSVRGMRAVRCTRPAKFTADTDRGQRRLCGIHARGWSLVTRDES